MGVTFVKLKILAAAALCVFVAGSSSAFAQAMTADDLKWINQCIADNRRQGATQEVVRKYCMCMNEKMDDGETLSITAWEKKNPKAQAACDKESGWK